MRAADVDHDAVAVERVGDERRIDHEGRAVQRLRRAEHRAAKRVGDHDVVANFDDEQGSLSRIADELAEYAAPGFQDIGKTLRKFAETRSAGASSASRRGSRGELDRGFEPLAMGERRAVRGRDLADLAGDELQAAAVERAAERHRAPSPAPYQLSSMMVASSPAILSAVASPAAVALA